jgi:hypothetical protein
MDMHKISLVAAEHNIIAFMIRINKFIGFNPFRVGADFYLLPRFYNRGYSKKSPSGLRGNT